MPIWNKYLVCRNLQEQVRKMGILAKHSKCLSFLLIAWAVPIYGKYKRISLLGGNAFGSLAALR